MKQVEIKMNAKIYRKDDITVSLCEIVGFTNIKNDICKPTVWIKNKYGDLLSYSKTIVLQRYNLMH